MKLNSVVIMGASLKDLAETDVIYFDQPMFFTSVL